MDWKDIVSNYKVYDLEQSLIASGYPMSTELVDRDLAEQDVVRGSKLSNLASKSNNAHAQFLSGITVSFDLTLTNKAWLEAERYRFLTFVSSQSTMHRITKFDLDNQYIEYVDPRMIDIMKEKINDYLKLCDAPIPVNFEKEFQQMKKQKYLEILYSNPSGFKLTARMTTNYRCLKNIYEQRFDHQLPEWRAFCEWIETLPLFEELINTKHLKDTVDKK